MMIVSLVLVHLVVQIGPPNSNQPELLTPIVTQEKFDSVDLEL